VATVYRDGKQFVVLDRQSRQLVRETPATPMAAVSDAFKRHHFPWRDVDPHAHLFRPWSLGTGELPDSVNAVLTARQAALKNKSTQQVDELRAAVEKLGYVVRDEGHRQFWRPLVRS
jgi:cysteinyl-tRNA synthetase